MNLRRRLGGAAAALLATIALTAAAAAQNSVLTVPLADGGSERVALAVPAHPAAVLVMLAGSDGVVEFDDGGRFTRLGGNFLLRTRALWLVQGFAVAVPAPPSGRSLLGERHTPAYADAIGRAVDAVRSKTSAPVWLVGTSQGSTAAANGAAELGGRIAGVVLSSSVTRPNRSGETVFDSRLGAIAVPVLIVANRGDTCPVTAPADAARIAAALTRSPRKQIVLVDSSEIRSERCKAMSPHGYLGIETAVVQRIADWIRPTAPR